LTILAAAIAGGSNSTSTLSQVEPGALGFLIVAGMALILVFLFRNMNKQFKKLPPPPEEEDFDLSAAADEAEQELASDSNLVVAGEVVADGQSGTGAKPVTAGKVLTGDPEQDARAAGTAKRK
jgi:hypothetical protein